MPILLVLVVAWVFTKKIFDHRERMEYAKQGLPPAASTGGAPAGAGAVPAGKPGKTGKGGRSYVPANAPFRGYVSTLWADLWDDARKRHARERAAKRPDGGRRVRDVVKGWWNWSKRPWGEADPNQPRPGDQATATAAPAATPVVSQQARPAVPPAPATTPGPQAAPGQGTPTPAAPPATKSNERFCPDCGEQMIEHPDGWWHRGRGACPVTGKGGPYAGPQKPVAGSSSPKPATQPQNAARPTSKPATPAGQPAPKTAEEVNADAARRNKHLAGEMCGDPRCGCALVNQRMRDREHAAGKMCGDPRCGCVCARCGIDKAEASGVCQHCTRVIAEAAKARTSTPPEPAPQQCTACGEVLVGISQQGHVCPKNPQNRNHDTKPYRPEPDDDAQERAEQTRVDAAHSAGKYCGDPACGECMDTKRVPESERFTPENAEKLRVDAKHLFGQFCGNPNCECACTRCRQSAAEVGGMCASCWNVLLARLEADNFGENRPTCPFCGTNKAVLYSDHPQMPKPGWVCATCFLFIPGDPPTAPEGADKKEGSTTAPAQGAPVTETPSDAGAAGPTCNTHNGTTDNGGTTVLEFNYDAIVKAHQDMLTDLNLRLEQATQVRDHAAKAKAASDGMDNARAQLVATANTLVDAMGEARFDTSSIEGCVSAAEAFSADDAGVIEEKTGELESRADVVIKVTNSAIESVQSSLNHIVATYGGLAEGVQSTGVRGAALEAA